MTPIFIRRSSERSWIGKRLNELRRASVEQRLGRSGGVDVRGGPSGTTLTGRASRKGAGNGAVWL